MLLFIVGVCLLLDLAQRTHQLVSKLYSTIKDVVDFVLNGLSVDVQTLSRTR